MRAASDKEKPVENTRGASVTTPSDREIVITRAFDAPRTVVFDAWTKAEHVAHWWDPSGAPLAVCEIDLRPTGAFRFVHGGPDGMKHSFAGIYREISAPARLVFTTRNSPSGAESVANRWRIATPCSRWVLLPERLEPWTTSMNTSGRLDRSVCRCGRSRFSTSRASERRK